MRPVLGDAYNRVGDRRASLGGSTGECATVPTRVRPEFLIALLAGCNGTPPAPSPSPTAGSPSSSTPATATADAEADFHAATTVSYERHLASHDWRAAWDALGDEAIVGLSFEDFAKERAEFGRSTKGQFVIKYVRHDRSEILRWLEMGGINIAADLDRAYLAWIDYPLLAGNNAGFELRVVAPVSKRMEDLGAPVTAAVAYPWVLATAPGRHPMRRAAGAPPHSGMDPTSNAWRRAAEIASAAGPMRA
jgi:hypothetical protein